MIFWATYPAVATRFLPTLRFGKRAQTGRSIRAAFILCDKVLFID